MQLAYLDWQYLTPLSQILSSPFLFAFGAPGSKESVAAHAAEDLLPNMSFQSFTVCVWSIIVIVTGCC